MHLDELVTCLREMAPEETALDGDPVGLLISPISDEVSSVAVCLDAYPPVVAQAVGDSVQLVIAHHPLIYAPLRRLDGEHSTSETVMTLVRAGLGLYAMHTNWDRAPGGVNDTLAGLLGLGQITAMAETGTAAIARIGSLPELIDHDELGRRISSALDCSRTSTLRSMRSRSNRPIRRVAVCGGAGGSLVNDAARAGADALVTADVRHHEYLEAYTRDIALFDAGHAATEEPGMRSLASQLANRFPGLSVQFLSL